MMLLKDLILFAIKIDYFMWDEKTNSEYTEPRFLTISHSPMNVITFNKEIKENLRVFHRHSEAVKYICSHDSLKNPCYGENVRIVKVKYNFEEQKWEEI